MRFSKMHSAWRPEFDAFLKSHYYGGLKHRFHVLNQMIRMTGLPRWYIKRQAARLGLSMVIDRRAWTEMELHSLERFVGRLSTAKIAKRLHRSEGSVVNKLKRLGTSRRVREGYTMRDLEQCLGEDHHKIAQWVRDGWLHDRPQGTKRHDGNGKDIHRIREKDILAFIKRHPQEINLGKVDQVWFLDLVLLRGCEMHEKEASHVRGETDEALVQVINEGSPTTGCSEGGQMRRIHVQGTNADHRGPAVDDHGRSRSRRQDQVVRGTAFPGEG